MSGGAGSSGHCREAVQVAAEICKVEGGITQQIFTHIPPLENHSSQNWAPIGSCMRVQNDCKQLWV